MDENELKQIVARKLAFFRKQSGLTQAQLAEKINYSDKSISKWERAEGLPDIFVLTELARIYGVTVDDFVSDIQPEKVAVPAGEKKKIIIPLLSVGLVWLGACIVFFSIKVFAPSLYGAYLAFLFAVPATFIVLIVFTGLWYDLFTQFLSVTGLVWSLTTCIYVTTVSFVPAQNMSLIFVVAGVFQVLTILWFWLIHNPNKKGRSFFRKKQ
ncbi:MAG: helix-turn-helix transcriptional regulator [Clostridia bacterium]|nr:helix-turn-helix transcriptional regulator [Clostridia bacterium]